MNRKVVLRRKIKCYSCVVSLLLITVAGIASSPKTPSETRDECITHVPMQTEGGECQSVGSYLFPVVFCEPISVTYEYYTCAPVEGKAPCDDWACGNELNDKAGFTAEMDIVEKPLSPDCAAALSAAAIICASGSPAACAAALLPMIASCGTSNRCELMTCNVDERTKLYFPKHTKCKAGCPDPPPPSSPKDC